MKIAHKDLDQKIYIIAEVGNNHEGNFAVAEKLVHLAAEAGVDAVKFQTIRPEFFVSPSNKQRFDQLKSYELKFEQFEKLSQLAKSCKIDFLTTVFDLDAVKLYNPLMPAYKVASGDNNFLALLEEMAKTGKPIILSTGLVEIEQIQYSKSLIEKTWKNLGIKQELALLHCVSSYPTPVEQANLKAISTLKENFNCTIGYSDHTLGTEAVCIAAAMGARIIEKHFTLDKNHSSFRDHQLSADPKDMAEIVRRIREIESYLGSGAKVAQENEAKALENMRRSIVAKHKLSAGQVLTWNDLCWMRPAKGLAPGEENKILGRKLKVEINTGELISLEILE